MASRTRWGKNGLMSRCCRAQKWRCCYCGVEMNRVNNHPREATREHLKRVADGGCNGLHNMAVACRQCNTRRGEVDWLTYKTLRMEKEYG